MTSVTGYWRSSSRLCEVSCILQETKRPVGRSTACNAITGDAKVDELTQKISDHEPLEEIARFRSAGRL